MGDNKGAMIEMNQGGASWMFNPEHIASMVVEKIEMDRYILEVRSSAGATIAQFTGSQDEMRHTMKTIAGRIWDKSWVLRSAKNGTRSRSGCGRARLSPPGFPRPRTP